jgi:hypothetical protein
MSQSRSNHRGSKCGKDGIFRAATPEECVVAAAATRGTRVFFRPGAAVAGPPAAVEMGSTAATGMAFWLGTIFRTKTGRRPAIFCPWVCDEHRPRTSRRQAGHFRQASAINPRNAVPSFGGEHSPENEAMEWLQWCRRSPNQPPTAHPFIKDLVLQWPADSDCRCGI